VAMLVVVFAVSLNGALLMAERGRRVSS